ncbi:hypothetical protein ACLOJK_041964 [Asimina triloba]
MRISLLSLSNKVLVEVRSLSNKVLMKVRSLSNKVLVEFRYTLDDKTCLHFLERRHYRAATPCLCIEEIALQLVDSQRHVHQRRESVERWRHHPGERIVPELEIEEPSAVDEIWNRTSEGIHVESHLMQVRHFWLLSQRMRMKKPAKELRRALSLGINKLQGPFPDFLSKGRAWQPDSDDAPGSGGRVWISRDPPRFLLQWVVICFPLARGCHYPKPGEAAIIWDRLSRHCESDIPEDLFAERKSTSSLSSGETAGIVVGVVVLILIVVISVICCVKRSKTMQKKGYITGPETLKLNGNVVNGNGVGSDMNSLNSRGHDNVNVFEIGSLVISINGLHLATNNFSEDNIAGKEGFGVVYKGVLHLPSGFLFSGGLGGGGVLHGSTCESVVCTLAAERDEVLKDMGRNNIGKLVVYGSDQTHFMLWKAAKLVGIHPANLRCLPTSAATAFAISPEVARKAMEEDMNAGLVPLYLCATVGTTGCGAVDPVEGLGRVAREHGVWFHVDAAYAGSACICPEFRPYLDGVDFADSLSMNAHKWLLTNKDNSCCLWVKSSNSLTGSLSTDPDILENKATSAKQVTDYKDWQIALSRRFRAIKLWLVLRAHGVESLRSHIRSDVALAQHFEELVRGCGAEERFRLKAAAEEEDGSGLNRKLLEAINSSGRARMTHAVLGGTFVLRFSVGSTLTEKRHVDAAWKLIQEMANSLCNIQEED